VVLALEKTQLACWAELQSVSRLGQDLCQWPVHQGQLCLQVLLALHVAALALAQGASLPVAQARLERLQCQWLAH
jgi:hypothetical protein